MSEIINSQIPNQLPAHEQERPERLSDEQLGNLLSAVGNHEGKALLLLAMQPERYYIQGELHGLVKNLPGAENVYIGSPTNQIGYCLNSLAPIGLVAKADYGSPTSFALTQEGENLGKPLAAFLLDFSSKYDVNLEAIFGASQSVNGKRSPFIRVELLKELLTSDKPLRLEDLRSSVGVAKPIPHMHLMKMAGAGLINYQSWDSSKDKASYELIDTNYEPTSKAGPVSRKTLEFLKVQKVATLDELENYCRETLIELPEIDQLRYDIVHYMASLGRRSVVKRSKALRSYQGASISIDDNQRSMLEELLNGLEQFKSQDPEFLHSLKVRSTEILSDSTVVKSALNRLAEKSPRMQNGDEKSLGRFILEALNNSEDVPMSIRDVVEQISNINGRNVSIFGIQKILAKMAKREEVQTTKKGRAKLYMKPADSKIRESLHT